MADLVTSTSLISEKILKIRWVPEHLKEADRFLTGSWEMDTNYVRLWRLQKNTYDYYEYVPECQDSIPFKGDISGMELVKDQNFAIGCTDGHVTLLKANLTTESDNLVKQARSSLLHSFETTGRAAPITGISVYGKDIATVGEDGRLKIIDATNLGTVHRTVDADDCSLTAVCYVQPQEVITANRMGVLRVFDTRSSADQECTFSFLAPRQHQEKRLNYVSCLISHPTQSHIVLSGAEEGSIAVWDLRNLSDPASYLSAHTSAITEIAFHKNDPTKLFSASECGDVWLWSENEQFNLGYEMRKTEQKNPWLSGDRVKHRISVKSIISDLKKSINSFDVHGSRIICSGDTEAVYFFELEM